MTITNISGVLTELDNIIALCLKNGSRQAYFATLYRNMTQAVKEGIENGVFEDGRRMEKLDIIFAQRYIDAWHCNDQNKPCSQSWKTAFDACDQQKLIVLQHLLLGINTHINLDLAIAASETAPGEAIFNLQTDFEKINQIISALTDEVQKRLELIWWPMKYLGKLVNGQEKAVMNFSITAARKTSWSNAVALALTAGEAKTNYINGIDRTVNKIARRIINPGMVTSLLIAQIKRLENKDVSETTTLLSGTTSHPDMLGNS